MHLACNTIATISYHITYSIVIHITSIYINIYIYIIYLLCSMSISSFTSHSLTRLYSHLHLCCAHNNIFMQLTLSSFIHFLCHAIHAYNTYQTHISIICLSHALPFYSHIYIYIYTYTCNVSCQYYLSMYLIIIYALASQYNAYT